MAIATRDRDLAPDGARASAATVEADGLHMTVFVPARGAAAVLRDLEAAPQAAVLFVRPTDDKACQLKGVFEGSRAAKAGERREVERQAEGFIASLEAIGIARELTASWVWWPCKAVRIRVTDIFEQTPGPGAGAPMR